MSVKLLRVAILTLLSFGAGAAAVQAMPFRSTQTGSTIPVSSGCGIGVNRGPYDGCDVINRGDYRARDYAHHRGRLKRKLDEMPGSIKAATDEAAADKLAAQAAAGKAAVEKLAGKKAAADKAAAKNAADKAEAERYAAKGASDKSADVSARFTDDPFAPGTGERERRLLPICGTKC